MAYINPYQSNGCCSLKTPATGCPIRLPGECVYYSGSTIAGPSINTGDNMNVVINKLASYTPPPADTITASNGLTRVVNDIQFGQSVSQTGAPATLLSNREIPMGNFVISLQGKVFVGNRVIEGTNYNFFDFPQLRAYYEQTTSANPTSHAFGSFQYLYLNNGASINVYRNQYASCVFRLKGSLSIVGEPTGANSNHFFFTKASDSSAALIVTGPTTALMAAANNKSLTGATNAGPITMSGWYAGYFSYLQVNQDAHHIDNFIDYSAGAYGVDNGSSVTNRYGLYINPLKQSFVSGNGYGIYQEGASDINYFNGTIGLGTSTIDPSAKLQVNSTTQGILFPRMTSTQRNAMSSPAAGLVIYNTTTNKLNVFTTVWEQVTSS